MGTPLAVKLALTILSLLAFYAMLADDASAQDASTERRAAAVPQLIAGADAFEAREFKAADGGVLRYRLLKPINYDAKQKYPLVLFLHGAGERGEDNARQLIHGGKTLADGAMRRRYPAFVVAPQCPADRRWVEVPWDVRTHAMPAEPSEPMRHVFELLAALRKEFAIDEARQYGVGLSMGGFGIWDILQREPDLLAAAVLICGGGDPAYAQAFAATPVWVFHGAADATVTVERSRDMVSALQAAGGHPIYTEYEGVGHDSWTETFDNRLIWDWLFAQRKK
jgi:predicted peptidase